MPNLDQASGELSANARKQLLALPAMRTRLEFQFAFLSAAGGIILASGQGNDSIAMLAVFAAVFGFIFVDWLRLFELPPIGAYLAMGAAAVYCVHDFWQMQQLGEPQMVSVALLLVLVQGVLMLQHKSRRILEQLAVFCLLELVVAAIFNDAIDFGLWMFPIAIVGASALSLLGLVALMESIDVSLDRQPAKIATTRLGRFMQFIAGQPDSNRQSDAIVASSSPESVVSIYMAAGAWSRYAVLALAPAVLVVAAAFFYVLPRRIEPSRSTSRGPALVGFDDEIRMEQLGRVMQNPKTALKVRLTDARTQQPYRLNEALYLRGKVLEQYEVDYSSQRPVAKWVSTEPESVSWMARLPVKYQPRDPTELNAFDDVDVRITCEPLSRPALFSIAPYHAREDAMDVVHSTGRWTLSRESLQPPFPRMTYEFGTHAFKAGVQTRLIAAPLATERAFAQYESQWQSGLRGGRIRRTRNDYTDLLQIDRSSVPSAAILAQQLLDEIPAAERQTSTIAEQFEQFLRRDPQFAYTLDLDATPIPNVDPVEQFLSVDRRGHCQFFASALALMLRSVGIPCRLVVGYRTEEYNTLGGYYIARQLHAHSWVEALIDSGQLTGQSNVSGQRLSTRYWMRLDPTPAESASDDGNKQGVDGLLNMANNIWEDYVVDMDSGRQNEDLVEATGLVEVQSSYQGALSALKRKIAEIRAGRLGGGDLSLRGRLPVVPIMVVLAVLAVVAFLLRFRMSKLLGMTRLFGGRFRKPADSIVQRPELMFYEQTLRQLERLAIRRRADETPLELMDRVGDGFPSLAVLTNAFVQIRYGTVDGVVHDPQQQALAELKAAVDRQLAESN